VKIFDGLGARGRFVVRRRDDAERASWGLAEATDTPTKHASYVGQWPSAENPAKSSIWLAQQLKRAVALWNARTSPVFVRAEELCVAKKKNSADPKGLQTFLEGCGLGSQSIERAVEARNAELPRTRPERKKSLKLERLSQQLRKEAKD
jgi:hypothetical protein